MEVEFGVEIEGSWFFCVLGLVIVGLLIVGWFEDFIEISWVDFLYEKVFFLFI